MVGDSIGRFRPKPDIDLQSVAARERRVTPHMAARSDRPQAR